MSRRNIIKLNLLALPARSFGVQYERIVGPRTSVAAQLRFMPKGPIPFVSIYENLDPTNNSDWLEAKIGSFAFTPEFRYYSRGVLRGFYFGPYFRYRTLNVEYTHNFNPTNSAYSIAMAAKGKLTTYATGFLLGQHFTMGSRLSMDIFAFGLQISYTKGSIEASSPVNLSAAYQQQLKNQVERDNDLSPILSRSTITHSRGFSSEVKSVFAGFRGLGLCLGIRL